MWVFLRRTAGDRGSLGRVLWLYAPRAVELIGEAEAGKCGWERRAGRAGKEDAGTKARNRFVGFIG